MDNTAYDVDIDMDDIDIAPYDDGDIYNTPNTTRIDEEETSILPTSTSRLILIGSKWKQTPKRVLLICYGITARIGYL